MQSASGCGSLVFVVGMCALEKRDGDMDSSCTGAGEEGGNEAHGDGGGTSDC